MKVNPTRPHHAHPRYNVNKTEGSEAYHEPLAKAPTPMPTSNAISMVPRAVAAFPSGAKSTVQAKIAGMLMPTDMP